MGRVVVCLLVCSVAAADTSSPVGDAARPALLAVAGRGASAWAVGERGVIVRLAPSGRRPLRSPTTRTLRAIAVDETGATAVGDGGVVIRWSVDDDAATLIRSPAAVDLVAVARVGGALYVASRYALYASRDGGAGWSELMSFDRIVQLGVRDGAIAVEAFTDRRPTQQFTVTVGAPGGWRTRLSDRLPRARFGGWSVVDFPTEPAVVAQAHGALALLRPDGRRTMRALWPRGERAAFAVGDGGGAFFTVDGRRWQEVP